jgi:hypothetical protein
MRRQYFLLPWILLLSVATIAVIPVAHARDSVDARVETGELTEMATANTLISQHIGAVMREIADRFSNSYWAANGGNWGLAQYQLVGLREALEVAKTRRPSLAPVLTTFEQTYNAPLLNAINQTNLPEFNRRFTVAINGCNECHAKLGRAFLRYQIPQPGESGSFLDFTAKTQPRRDGTGR